HGTRAKSYITSKRVTDPDDRPGRDTAPRGDMTSNDNGSTTGPSPLDISTASCPWDVFTFVWRIVECRLICATAMFVGRPAVARDYRTGTMAPKRRRRRDSFDQSRKREGDDSAGAH